MRPVTSPGVPFLLQREEDLVADCAPVPAACVRCRGGWSLAPAVAAPQPQHGRFVAQWFLHRLRQQARVAAQLVQVLGLAQQGEHPVGDQVDRGLVSGDEEQRGGRPGRAAPKIACAGRPGARSTRSSGTAVAYGNPSSPCSWNTSGARGTHCAQPWQCVRSTTVCILTAPSVVSRPRFRRGRTRAPARHGSGDGNLGQLVRPGRRLSPGCGRVRRPNR